MKMVNYREKDERCRECTPYAVLCVYVLSGGRYIMKYFPNGHVDKGEITEMEHISPQNPIWIEYFC